MTAARLSLVAFSTLIFCSPGTAQESPEGLVGLPIFQALTGKRVESGILIPQANGQPLPGKATSTGAITGDGKGFLIEGSAEYGPVKWDYRWVFVFGGERGKHAVTATYTDSMGQTLPYLGDYDLENQRVQLIANLNDGGIARLQFSLEGPGLIQISSVISDSNDDPMVTYSAQNVAAE